MKYVCEFFIKAIIEIPELIFNLFRNTYCHVCKVLHSPIECKYYLANYMV